VAAGAAGFGDGAEKDQGEASEASGSEGIEKFRGGETGSGRNGVKSFVFVGSVADSFDSEPNLHAGSVQGGAGKVDYGGSGFASGGKIALGECCGAREEDELSTRKRAFFDWLNDGGLAGCFGQRAGNGFFVY